jgi:indolepyruvate decarboxylase
MSSHAQTLPLGQFLFDYLYRQGIHDAFGIPGDFVLPTFRWLEASPIKLYTMTHEPSVGFAADAYARIHGLGLAAITYCVGGLNMVNSIACAYAEKSPVIVISGGPSRNDRRNDPLLHHKVKTFDTQRRVFEEVTCANTILLDPETAILEIMRVVEKVKQECRPGYIEIPYDMIDEYVSLPTRTSYTLPAVSDPEILEAFVYEVVDRINKSKQPVIIADVELHRHGLVDPVLDIATRFNIPIAATLLSKSIIPENHPLYLGVYSGGLSEAHCQDYVEKSDCLLMLGTFITDVFLGQYTAHLDRKHSIILTTEQATVGLHNYKQVLLADALAALRKSSISPKSFHYQVPESATPKWLAMPAETPITVEGFFAILSQFIGDGSTVICDTGDALLGAIGLKTSQRKNFLSDAYYLSMGFAAPAAIGASVASNEGRVFAIIGDGAFQMTGTELSTAAKYRLAPIVIILNNDGYGTQRHIIDGPFNHIHPWHYTKLVDMLGYGVAHGVTTHGELEQALKQALSDSVMHLIEVRIDRDDCSPSLRKMGEQLGKLRDKQKQQ